MLVAINTFAILCVAFVFFLTFSRKTPLIIQNIKYKSTNTKYATPLQCSTLLLPPRPFHATTGEEYTFHPVLFLYSTKWFLFLREPGIYHSIEIHSRSANPIIVFIVIDEESDRFMKVSKDTSTGIATAAAVAAVPSCIIHRATPLHQQANHHLVRSSANQLYLFLYSCIFPSTAQCAVHTVCFLSNRTSWEIS